MAHAFAPIPAKPTFGTLRENLYQSDYLERKKGKLIYCNNRSICSKLRIAKDYDQYNLFNLGKYARSLETCNIIPINKGNLVIGQYTKLNLNNVCTVIPINNTPCNLINFCPPCLTKETVIVDPTSTVPFYESYYIDPLGELFGNSQCGEQNYTSYMEFNPPPPPRLLGNS